MRLGSRSGRSSPLRSCWRRASIVYALAPQSVLLAALAHDAGWARTSPVPARRSARWRRGRARLRCSGWPSLAVRERLAARGPAGSSRRRGCGRPLLGVRAVGALLRHVVRVRDARVDDPLARGARLARAPLPRRAACIATRSRSSRRSRSSPSRCTERVEHLLAWARRLVAQLARRDRPAPAGRASERASRPVRSPDGPCSAGQPARAARRASAASSPLHHLPERSRPT